MPVVLWISQWDCPPKLGISQMRANAGLRHVLRSSMCGFLCKDGKGSAVRWCLACEVRRLRRSMLQRCWSTRIAVSVGRSSKHAIPRYWERGLRVRQDKDAGTKEEENKKEEERKKRKKKKEEKKEKEVRWRYCGTCASNQLGEEWDGGRVLAMDTTVSLKRSDPPPRSVCHDPAHIPKILQHVTISHIAQ